MKQPKEKRQHHRKLSEAEYHTRLLLEEQRNQILSEAKYEMNIQELKRESANMALRELNRQVRSHHVDLPPYESYMRILGESSPGSKQTSRTEKERFKKLELELSRKWKN